MKKMTLRKCVIELKIIVNGLVIKTAPLKLSTPDKNQDYISTRMTPGIFTHQCLKRPCKES